MKTLEEMVEFLASIPQINQGGCAVAAYNLNEYLTKNGKSSKIVFLFSEADRQRGRISNLKNNIPDTCLHAVVELDGCFIDSTGINGKEQVFSKWGFIETSFEIPRELVKESIEKATDWNTNFNRKRYKPEIEKYFGNRKLGIFEEMFQDINVMKRLFKSFDVIA